MKLIDLSIAEANKMLRSKQISTKELIEAHIQQVQTTAHLNAYVLNTFEHALDQAEIAQNNINNSQARALEGIPVAVKDLFCTKDFRSTACSKILENFIPPYESTVTSKLFASGAIMVGKTNMDEFAMGSTNETSAFGACINPWQSSSEPNKQLVPGGSSGGSAIAVAARTALASLGSDTGGSVRQPAAFNGIVGVKPSYGRCSRFGMIAFSSSLDQAGVFARNVQDSAFILENIMGADAYDSTLISSNPPKLSNLELTSLKGLKVGIPKEYLTSTLPEGIKKYMEMGKEWLTAQGAEIKEVSLPHTEYALPIYYILAPAEASSNLARYDGVRYGYRTSSIVKSIDDMYSITRDEGFGDEVKRRILIGTFVLSSSHFSSYFTKAQQARTLVIQDFKNVFNDVDVLLAPSTPSAAFGIKEELDPVTIYHNDIFTIPASLAGLPCMSVPVGLDHNSLPVGLQLIAKQFDELTLYKTALALEDAAEFKHKPQILTE
ncbi:Asp-tRNA(Asn)/Glu-tRNA(Gln) amidotransferase subunit GatA [Rickettsiales endosymbiont of Stachyamoeba lipophora]|uniref:Asp-tRNA(Asn)/Glu-tRNA(Gln) amidotransferase subunit GatA n=1 Tax=Rickettsiales endosymbiont of Stachyamoeba lipophora TaxID=2486578 RepID=UPI000F652EAA|nr:Asp-tRNA(Asn)/Glu-tRNA(Gln) amidotransferase subunit GatA [Rickettsiales endosymbiont of Stachyamoeba lipophora]AZL15026.1 Asp-tRNA(Asn)/Glu-tRNA(Gln) amidotransferase subunit GatA [Rickettsiales endosymbiont of Stachyamoeba lipophora]